MIPVVGDVLFDGEFVFRDGQTGKKWFIILADIGDDTDNIYVARTTTKEKSPKVEACYTDDFEPVYFLEAGNTFRADTWVQFDQVLMFDFSRAERLKKESHQKKQLSMQTMYKILSCAAQSIHIDGYTEETLLKQAKIFK